MNATPGLSFGNDASVMNSPTGTWSVGDCVAVDMTAIDASFRWTTLRQVVTADFVTASSAANAQTFLGILQDASTVAGTKVRVLFRGQIGALCVSATTAGVTRLTGTNTAAGLTTAAAASGTGQRAVAIALETNATANVIKQVMFNGLEGFGYTIVNTT